MTSAGGGGSSCTSILSAALAVSLLASVTSTVKFESPATVGAPLISPVLASRVRPLGSAPRLILQLIGPCPPVAVRVWA